MKNRYPSVLIPFICFLIFLISCQTEDLPVLNVPEDEWIIYQTFEFQNIDSVRYWGDSDKIRLQSGVIMLRPDNQTYLKKFIGTGDKALDPEQVKWSKEEPGKYIFSFDSTRIFFSNDPHVVYYSPGYWSSGIYHQPRLEQHDSVWYSISYFSMGVSGRFVYSEKPGIP
jgi:hypothetical protein